MGQDIDTDFFSEDRVKEIFDEWMVLEGQNRWKFLTSMNPDLAISLITDYEKVYASLITDWEAGEIDQKFFPNEEK